MSGIAYQLKNVRRDKLSILTFLLPIILGLAVNVFSNFELSETSEPVYGVVNDHLTNEQTQWLRSVGKVKSYKNQEQLHQAVNDPASQLIGVAADGNALKTFLSGDEWSLYQTLGQKIPAMYAQREDASSVKVDIHFAKSNGDWLKRLFLVITMVTAMFMGCTFNAMNIIGEKEEGIAMINKIIPMTRREYLIQKIFLGFCGAAVSAILTACICIRLNSTLVVALLGLIVLSAFIAGLLGLFIGYFSSNMMVGIVYIKLVMILYLAPPILFYLLIPENSSLRLYSFILPSSCTFYGLMDLLNGRFESILYYCGILAIHCVLGLTFYLFIIGRRKAMEEI
ncbi:ABC transporter permease [Enterococcus sp. DIV0756]|uniref:ABC transporter permease n=1 Tax=Enterococcus sp. DIV0756 TaxID=2774636 RepID=UPI003F22437B